MPSLPRDCFGVFCQRRAEYCDRPTQSCLPCEELCHGGHSGVQYSCRRLCPDYSHSTSTTTALYKVAHALDKDNNSPVPQSLWAIIGVLVVIILAAALIVGVVYLARKIWLYMQAPPDKLRVEHNNGAKTPLIGDKNTETGAQNGNVLQELRVDRGQLSLQNVPDGSNNLVPHYQSRQQVVAPAAVHFAQNTDPNARNMGNRDVQNITLAPGGARNMGNRDVQNISLAPGGARNVLPVQCRSTSSRTDNTTQTYEESSSRLQFTEKQKHVMKDTCGVDRSQLATGATRQHNRFKMSPSKNPDNEPEDPTEVKQKVQGSTRG